MPDPQQQSDTDDAETIDVDGVRVDADDRAMGENVTGTSARAEADVLVGDESDDELEVESIGDDAAIESVEIDGPETDGTVVDGPDDDGIDGTDAAAADVEPSESEDGDEFAVDEETHRRLPIEPEPNADGEIDPAESALDDVDPDETDPDVTDPAESDLVETDPVQSESESAPVDAESDGESAAPIAAPTASVTAPARGAALKSTASKSTAEESMAEESTAQEAGDLAPVVLSFSGLSKRYGSTVAVDGIELQVRQGAFYGIVGPNGAGKTTTLSMITGLLRPDAGDVTVHGVDVWKNPTAAKKLLGVLPDRLRLFDRLTGAQLLYYSGTLRGLDGATVKARATELAAAFGFEDALGRLVSDYSAGMTKKVALAAALIHAPRILVLDEPFESVDPVSAATVIEILQKYVANGGTVVLSSHGMDFIQRICDSVAIIVGGRIVTAGTVDEVRDGSSLEEKFVELAGGRKVAEGMEWLHSFSD